MAKQTLTEGVVDRIFKLLAVGKYKKIQQKFKSDKKVQKAIKKAEMARKELVNAIDDYAKATDMDMSQKSDLEKELIRKYGR